MKAAKILGSQAPVHDAQRSDGNSLDIDFSDVAMAPSDSPPPVPLRSSAGGVAASLPAGIVRPSLHSGASGNGSSMYDSERLHSGQLSLDPPIHQKSRNQEISPFLFQEEHERRNTTTSSSSRLLNHRQASASDIGSSSAGAGRSGSAGGGGGGVGGFGGSTSSGNGGGGGGGSGSASAGIVGGFFSSSSHPHGHHGSVQFAQRPSTPPAASSSLASSASQLSLAGATTPVHKNRSKNPLNKFFRKKSATTLREGEASPSSTPRIPAYGLPSGSTAASSSTQASSIGSAAGSRLDVRGGIAGIAGVGGGSNSGGGVGDNSQALGLDEELHWDEGFMTSSFRETARKSKLTGRPRTRDKEVKRAKTADGERTEPSLGGGLTAGAQHPLRQTKEVPISLDTNFDQIDDIVDVSFRNQSMIGPMNEPLSPNAADGQIVNTSRKVSEPTSPTLIRTARERSTSVSFVEHGRRSTSTLDSPAKQRPNTLRRLATATGSNVPVQRPVLQSQNSSPGPIGLQRISRAEAHALIAARNASGGSTPTATTPQAYGSSSSSEDPMHRPSLRGEQDTGSDRRSVSTASIMNGMATLSESNSLNTTPMTVRDDRKASYASTSSRLTNGSDISPTTSVNNLASRAAMRPGLSDRRPSAQNYVSGSGGGGGGGGGVDAGYKFPPNLSRNPTTEQRKASASSGGGGAGGGGGGGKVTSSWMAPDSWAVQEDTIRDALRDEEEEAHDESLSPRIDPLSNSPGPLKRDASARPSLTSSLWSNLASPAAHQSSISSSSEGMMGSASSQYALRDGGGLQSRRETIDSNVSTSSTAMDRDNSTSNESAYEVLQTNGQGGGGANAASLGTTPTPQSVLSGTSAVASHSSSYQSQRPTSRGGSTIGHAAAAAAGKLGLHRPARIKITRPGTAGSLNGFPAPPKGQSTTPLAEEDYSNASSWKLSKRTPTQAHHPINRHSFMRIYKDDGTHSVVSISLEATAAELRTILARKSVDPAKVNRLFVRDKGSERPLGESEKPAQLQRRRLMQAGYTEADLLDDIGREDLTFLLKFVYRSDKVTNFDSYSFGNTEADFNVLDLRNRNLEMVPIFLYRHGEWIKSLDLSGNPMHDVPLDFIQLCSNLTTLRLSNLSLKRIPQSIRQAVHLTHLDVSDNRIRDVAHVNLADIPQLMSLKMQNNRLADLPAYFAQMQHLMDLNVSNNRFDVFPAVVCELSRLSQLDISFNTLTKLPEELSSLSELQRLVLVGNSIEQLPESMSKMTSLQAIDVRRNLLQHISSLFGLPRLEVLKCEHNSIKHLDVTFGARLKTLEIGQNPLSKATFAAPSMCALTVLNLSSANMGKLDEKVFGQLPNLTVLDLDQNNLIMLPENLGQLSQLTRLTCTNNVLATLPDSIGLLANLTELLIHNNNLKALPSSIWHCGNLRHVNVSSNLLESFPNPNEAAAGVPYQDASMANSGILANPSESRKGSAGSLGPLPGTGGRAAAAALPLSMCLTKLRLGDNHLSEDVFQSLSHLPELQILNLSSNELYEIPTYGLTHLVKLRELYLSGNSLGSIPADALPLLRELRILHINGNKLQTLPAEIGRMHKLVNFDVSNNSLKYNISNQQYDWNWNSNPNLHYLNLSGNKRFEIKSNPVMAAAAAHHQHAGHTSSDGWRRTDSSDFQRLTSLRLLGLMDVTVTLQQMPDEFEDRRVRTSLSQINQMAYGISDTLGQHDHLSNIDVVIPRFRKRENECLFGLFSGRGHGERMGSRIAFHLAQWVNFRIQWEVQRLQPPGQNQSPDTAKVADIIRRAFLRMEKEYADVLISEASRSELKINYAKSDTPINHGSSFTGGSAVADSVAMMNWRSGASAVLAYVIDRTLFTANCGDALAVMSRNSTAHLVSTKHEPFDRNETLRIRSAEGWVSLQGEVNDTLDVSRSFGHYHLAPIVNAAPAVTQIELTDSDEFVILANRTLWDFIPYQTAVDIARMERDDLMLAAQKLRDYAIAYGAEDGIMVMVVAVGDLFEKTTSSRNRQQTMTTLGGASAALDATSAAASAMFEPQWDGFRQFKARHGGRDFLPGDRTIARLQREVAPPVGQVALVFTDIRNSTSLWETNGGMQSAMRIHNFLLRRQLRNIGGYEVKTEGDAFMVSFQTVTSALLWCFQVQIQLLKEPWPQEILESEDGKEIYDPNTGEVLYRGLSVRMGIHWGSPVCEADPITRRMDYFGPMVNRASRISGAAEGGQILASKDVVAELRAIMGTFDEDRRRTYMDGGAAAEQVTSPPAIVEGMDEKEAEEAFRLLNQNVSRDVVLLRRMGFAISDVGERRLKGLETPEFLNLVYPKSLTGRFAKLIENANGGASALRRPVSLQTSADNGDVQAAVERAGGDVTAANVADADTVNQILADAAKDGAAIPVEVFEPTIHLLSVDEVKTVGYLCLRLEALALGTVFEGIDGLVNAEQQQHLLNSPARAGSTTTKKPRTFSHSVPIVGADRAISPPTNAAATDVIAEAVGSLPVLPQVSQRQTLVENHLNHHPELTLPGMRDDATDEELYAVLLTLTSRIWIALGTLTVRKLVAGQNGHGVEGLGLGVDISQILDALQDAFHQRRA